MLRFSEQQTKALQVVKENGAITLKHGRQIYSHDWSFYRAMETLEDMSILKRRNAPESSDYEYVWTIVDGREPLLDMLDPSKNKSN